MAAIALIGVLTLPQDRPGTSGSRLDVPGALLGSGGLAALTYGLGEVESGGTLNVLALLLVCVGVALLAAFLWWQTRTSSPLLTPYAFMGRNRAGSLLALVLAGTGVLALFASITFYLQRFHGYLSPATWTLLLVLTAAIVIGSTQVSARLLHRAPPQVLIAAGLVLTAAGLLLLAGVDESLSPGRSLPSMVLTGLGLGMAWVPLFATVTAGVAPRQAGGASAAIATAQQLGEAIGGMLLGLVIAGLGRPESTQGVTRWLMGGYSAFLWWGFGALLLAALTGGLMVTTREPRRPGGQPAGTP